MNLIVMVMVMRCDPLTTGIFAKFDSSSVTKLFVTLTLSINSNTSDLFKRSGVIKIFQIGMFQMFLV